MRHSLRTQLKFHMASKQCGASMGNTPLRQVNTRNVFVLASIRNLCVSFRHRKINPVENVSVSIVAMGEGWHNYHHVFPWDYKAAELAHRFNITTFWIQLFAKIGWAYDLKEPSAELVRRTIEKCGKLYQSFHKRKKVRIKE